jgi:hypothetical protein
MAETLYFRTFYLYETLLQRKRQLDRSSRAAMSSSLAAMSGVVYYS